MRLLCIQIAAFACFCLSAGGALSMPNDFARGRLIEVQSVSDLARVMVPQDVYEWVTRSDLGDLRVLGADGEEIPYALQRPQGSDEYSAWERVGLFEVPGGDIGTSGGTQVNVEVDSQGGVVAISGAAVDTISPPAFLLDLNSVQKNAAQPSTGSLRLSRAEGSGDYIGKFRVDDAVDFFRAVRD